VSSPRLAPRRRHRRTEQEPCADHELPAPRHDRQEPLDEATRGAKRCARIADISRAESNEEPKDGKRGERGGDGVRGQPLPVLVEAHPPGEEEEPDAEGQRPADEADDVKQAAHGPNRTHVAPRTDAIPAARTYELGDIAAQYRECARESAH